MLDGKKTLFSGMQATGNLTLGNYLGALKNWVTISDDYQTFFSVVDMHSITVRQDPAELRKRARTLLTLYIAAGLDPEKNCIYYQSHVRMRGAAKEGEQTAFQNSFGFPTDPFPTLLAGTVTPFAFWYEDDPAGGCIRFPTELECERLMGLPEGWTKYGADGREISASQRYKALGNAIALPCAEYIMAGIAEALR